MNTYCTSIAFDTLVAEILTVDIGIPRLTHSSARQLRWDVWPFFWRLELHIVTVVPIWILN